MVQSVSGPFGCLSLILKVVFLNGLFTSDRGARDKIEVQYLSHRKYHNKALLFCAINRLEGREAGRKDEGRLAGRLAAFWLYSLFKASLVYVGKPNVT